MQDQLTLELCNTGSDTNRGAVLCSVELVDGKAPKKVMMFPAPKAEGKIDAVDGRSFKMFEQEAFAAAFNSRGKPIPFDLEHSSEILAPKGHPAPAHGWINKLSVVDGAVWADVEWTPKGASMIEAKEYRFASPAFKTDSDKRIRQLVSAGLTNRPALDMPALASLQGVEPMNEKLLKLLGLAKDATPEQIDAAVDAHNAKLVAEANASATKIKELETASAQLKVELASAQSAAPKLELFVPRSEHDAVRTELASVKASIEAEKAAAFKKEVLAAVDQASTDRKILPANRDYFIETCSTKEALEKFKTYIAGAPVLVTPTAPAAAAPAGQGDVNTCTEDELAVWAKLGLTKEQGLAAKKS